MRFAWGVLLVLLLVLLAGCIQPAPQPSPQPAPEPEPTPAPAPEPDFSCTTPADCEAKDLVHIMCVGDWTCVDNRCAFECSVESPLEQPAPEPTPVAEPAPAPQPVEVTVNLHAFNWGFEPSRVEVPLGSQVKFVVSTEDAEHGLAIPAFGVSQKLTPGKITEVEFVADQAGEFPFYCNVFCGAGHKEMQGTLVVKPAP